ncbi:MAG: hypothetical protein WD716_03965 [Fimbriimonadaceae bacterium]
MEVALDSLPHLVSGSISLDVVASLEGDYGLPSSIEERLSVASVQMRSLKASLEKLRPSSALFADQSRRAIQALQISSYQLERNRALWRQGYVVAPVELTDPYWIENIGSDWRILELALAELEGLLREFTTSMSFGAWLDAEALRLSNEVYSSVAVLRLLAEAAHLRSKRVFDRKFSRLKPLFDAMSRGGLDLSSKFEPLGSTPDGLDNDAAAAYALVYEAVRASQTPPTVEPAQAPSGPMAGSSFATPYALARNTIREGFEEDPGFLLPAKVACASVFADGWASARRHDVYYGILRGHNPRRLEPDKIRKVRSETATAINDRLHGA